MSARPGVYASHAEAIDSQKGKKPIWHSRRHQTDAAHLEATRDWVENQSPAARRQRTLERQATRAERTPTEQLTLLDKRPGESARERARLEAQIAQES